MNRKNEKGVALILALILLLIVSVMAVSLMFISQTETRASMNYTVTGCSILSPGRRTSRPSPSDGTGRASSCS
jgi:hypothetical protein